MMARIEVFLDENKFHAIPLEVPHECAGLISMEECDLLVDNTGLTVIDPSGALQPAHFLFKRMKSWSTDSGSTCITIKTPQGAFSFSCEQSLQLSRKLTDIHDSTL